MAEARIVPHKLNLCADQRLTALERERQPSIRRHLHQNAAFNRDADLSSFGGRPDGGSSHHNKRYQSGNHQRWSARSPANANERPHTTCRDGEIAMQQVLQVVCASPDLKRPWHVRKFEALDGAYVRGVHRLAPFQTSVNGSTARDRQPDHRPPPPGHGPTAPCGLSGVLHRSRDVPLLRT
jgi:hypothetical protein